MTTITNKSSIFAPAQQISILKLQSSAMSHEPDFKKQAAFNAETAKDPIEKLRYKCLSRGPAGIKELGRTFKIYDDDENHTLSFDEFYKGIKDYALKISEKDARAAFDQIDRDKTGTLNFDEFLEALRPPLSKARIALIEQAFKKFDKTGDGVVTVADMEGVYDHRKHPKFVSGEWTKEEVFKKFLENFEIRGNVDGKVTKKEFFDYYAGISASIDTDIYFDLMMRNCWKL